MLAELHGGMWALSCRHKKESTSPQPSTRHAHTRHAHTHGCVHHMMPFALACACSHERTGIVLAKRRWHCKHAASTAHQCVRTACVDGRSRHQVKRASSRTTSSEEPPALCFLQFPLSKQPFVRRISAKAGSCRKPSSRFQLSIWLKRSAHTAKLSPLQQQPSQLSSHSHGGTP